MARFEFEYLPTGMWIVRDNQTHIETRCPDDEYVYHLLLQAGATKDDVRNFKAYALGINVAGPMFGLDSSETRH
jgi:hypothetical protein